MGLTFAPIGRPLILWCARLWASSYLSNSSGLEVICVPYKPVDDEQVKHYDDDRQHRRYRDIKEPPDDPQSSECDARGPPTRSAPYDTDPRIHRYRADNQVDD